MSVLIWPLFLLLLYLNCHLRLFNVLVGKGLCVRYDLPEFFFIYIDTGNFNFLNRQIGQKFVTQAVLYLGNKWSHLELRMKVVIKAYQRDRYVLLM